MEYIEDENCYRNREHFSFALINQLMKKYRFRFHVEKGSLGLCWTEGCENLKEKNKYYCHTFQYRKRGCRFKEKLKDLEDNSVFSIVEYS